MPVRLLYRLIRGPAVLSPRDRKQACPERTYCPVGSSNTTACPAGHYCPVETATPIACPKGYYCPLASSEPTACFLGTFCPERSEMFARCPLGWYASANSNNTFWERDGSCAEVSGRPFSWARGETLV